MHRAGAENKVCTDVKTSITTIYNPVYRRNKSAFMGIIAIPLAQQIIVNFYINLHNGLIMKT